MKASKRNWTITTRVYVAEVITCLIQFFNTSIHEPERKVFGSMTSYIINSALVVIIIIQVIEWNKSARECSSGIQWII